MPDISVSESTSLVMNIKSPRLSPSDRMSHCVMDLGFALTEKEDRLNRWQGMKVHVKHGQIEPRRYSLPGEFLEYLNSKARREAELFSRISSRQLEKIDRAFRANADEFAGSDACLAMQYDLRLFGDAAFAPDNSK